MTETHFCYVEQNITQITYHNNVRGTLIEL